MRRMIPQKKRLLNADVYNLVPCCYLTNFVLFIEKITFWNQFSLFWWQWRWPDRIWQIFHLCWKILKVHNLVPCCCLTNFVLLYWKITLFKPIQPVLMAVEVTWWRFVKFFTSVGKFWNPGQRRVANSSLALKMSLSHHIKIKAAGFVDQDRYCLISSDWCIVS